jgi:hypothetical protein
MPSNVQENVRVVEVFGNLIAESYSVWLRENSQILFKQPQSLH